MTQTTDLKTRRSLGFFTRLQPVGALVLAATLVACGGPPPGTSTAKVRRGHPANWLDPANATGQEELVTDTSVPTGTVLAVPVEASEQVGRFAYWDGEVRVPNTEFVLINGIEAIPNLEPKEAAELIQQSKDASWLVRRDDLISAENLPANPAVKDPGKLVRLKKGVALYRLEDPKDPGAPEGSPEDTANPPGPGQVSHPAPSPAPANIPAPECVRGYPGYFLNWIQAGVPGKALCNLVHFLNVPANFAKISNHRYAAIADYTRPSEEHRLFILDFADGAIERFRVAHGGGVLHRVVRRRHHHRRIHKSGHLNSQEMATHFSDSEDSNLSPAGFLLATDTYDGKHGESLRLEGLEKRNEHTLDRNVVLHGASYVSDHYVKENGAVGRSEGCPAVSPAAIRHLIDLLHGGAVFYSFIGDSNQQQLH